MLFMLSHKQTNLLTEDLVLLFATNCKLIVDLEKNYFYWFIRMCRDRPIVPSSTAAAGAKRS